MKHTNARLDDVEEDEEAVSPLKQLRSRRASRGAMDSKGVAAALKEEIFYDYDIKSYAVEKPLRELRLTLPLMSQPIILNPLTTGIGMLPLWAMVIWCVVSIKVVDMSMFFQLLTGPFASALQRHYQKRRSKCCLSYDVILRIRGLGLSSLPNLCRSSF